jgi:hypothetical protein
MWEAPDATPLRHCRAIYEVWGLEEVEGRGREQRGRFRRHRGGFARGSRRSIAVGVGVGRVVRHERIHRLTTISTGSSQRPEGANRIHRWPRLRPSELSYPLFPLSMAPAGGGRRRRVAGGGEEARCAGAKGCGSLEEEAALWSFGKERI